MRWSRIAHEAPILWDEFREALQSNIATFNAGRRTFNYQEPGGLVDTRNVYIGRFDGQKHVRIIYHTGTLRITCQLYSARAASIKDMLTEEVVEGTADKSAFSKLSQISISAYDEPVS